MKVIASSDSSEEEFSMRVAPKKKLGVRNSVQPNPAKLNPLSNESMVDKKKNRKFTSDSMQIPEGQLKKMAKE